MLAGRAFATLSARSAAAFRLIAVAGPPGGLGEAGRAPVVVPVEGELTGEEGRGEDCCSLGQCMRAWCAGSVQGAVRDEGMGGSGMGSCEFSRRE